MYRLAYVLYVLFVLLLIPAAIAADGPPLYNFLGSNREDSVSAAFWSEGAPTRPVTGNLGPMLNSQRIVNPTLTNPNNYLFHNFFGVTVTGGNAPAQSALGAFVRSTSSHNVLGGKDVTAASTHTRVEGGSTARGYGGWDSAWNYSNAGQAIGREIDVVNQTGLTAPTTLGSGATTGLAITGLAYGSGSLYNTYGLLFQAPSQAAFRTGIYFEAPAVVAHSESLRIPNETWISSWKSDDSGPARLIALDGVNDLRIRMQTGRRVLIDNEAGAPVITIDAAGVKLQGGHTIKSDATGLWVHSPVSGTWTLLAPP